MKIGDIVRVDDGSWSISVNTKTLQTSHYADILKTSVNYRILAVGCDLPADNWYFKNKRNDTLCVRVDRPEELLFIQYRFLIPVEPPAENENPVIVHVPAGTKEIKVIFDNK